jgi:hypothetical protein
VSSSKKIWYKIVEIDDNKKVRSLFHGTNGTRLLKIERWMTANQKLVTDGSGVTRYLSGWQIVPSFRECLDYLQLFKKKEGKAIVCCKAKNVKPKQHSRHPVYLAKEIKIERSPIVYVHESDDNQL